MKGEGIAWDYLLAEKLGVPAHVVAAMPNVEYETWQDYITVQATLADLERRTQEARARGNR